MRGEYSEMNIRIYDVNIVKILDNVDHGLSVQFKYIYAPGVMPAYNGLSGEIQIPCLSRAGMYIPLMLSIDRLNMLNLE